MPEFRVLKFLNPNILLLCALGVLITTALVGNFSTLILAVPLLIVIGGLFYFSLFPKIKSFNAQSKILLSLFVIAATILYYKMALTTPTFVADKDPVIRWGYMDKRPLIIGLILVYIAICFVKFLDVFNPKIKPLLPHSALSDRIFPHRISTRLCFGALGALAFFLAGIDLLNPDIIIDSHLEGLLGGMKQIHDGSVPYVEAKTQYGPGTQILLHEMMNIYGHTYEGAYRSQQLLNLLCLSGFGFLLFWYAGPVIGSLTLVMLAALPGPFYFFNFPGWGIYLRWLGGLTIALLLAEIFFSNRLIHTRILKWIALLFTGLLMGIFCFMSQEAVSSSIVACVCIIGLATGFKNISLPGAILSGLLIISAAAVSFLVLEMAFIGKEHLAEMLHEYFRGPRMVSAGISNTGWNNPTPFHLSFFYLSIFANVIALLLLTTAKISGRLTLHRFKIFTGLIVGSLILNFTTLLRVDTAHMDGPAFLSYTLILVIGAMVWHGDQMQKHIRKLGLYTAFAMIACFVLVPMSVKNLDLRAVTSGKSFLSPVQWQSVAKALRGTGTPAMTKKRTQTNFDNFFISNSSNSDVNFINRNGLEMPYAEMLLLSKRLNAIVDGRKTVVTSELTLKRSKIMPGAIYFYANLQPATEITEPMLSVWLESERTAWIEDINASDAGCLVSGGWNDDLILTSWKNSLGTAKESLTEQVIEIGDEPVAKVYCR